MKRSVVKKYSLLLLVGAALLNMSSCKKVFDLEPADAVDNAQAYQTVYDADAAVVGIYGKVMRIAKQYMLFNEMRADLMDITNNSDQYLKQLSEHNPSNANPYINPKPFYEVIINCNDVLMNFDIMYKANKLKEADYKYRYSDVGAIRSWVYLQLGIHYGRIPYVTDPLAQISDIQDASKFPMLELEPLIDTLIRFTESLPYKEDYPTGTTLITTVDGYNTQKFFINKNILLGDLYLWDAQYRQAATYYRKVMETGSNLAVGEAYYNTYRISSFGEAAITYSRAQDFSSLVYTPGWRYLFERGQDNPFNWEWIWVLPFDAKFAPENPFVELFSPNGGSYLARPSQAAIDNWNSQTQIFTFTSGTGTAAAVYRDNFPLDSRGVFTYRTIGGQPVIMKYLYNYLGTNNVPSNVFNTQGKWFLARAAGVHLKFAEAANRDGQYKVAYALTNRGIKDTYDPLPGAAQNRDVTTIHQTMQPAPYDFDARLGDAPAYRNIWYRNIGIRGRAALKAVPVTSTTDSLIQVENMVINENALELAYEGQRWPDLLRVAMRRNDPSFLADKVYNKLIKSGLSAGAAGQARAKLLARDWFLPFKWQ